MIDIGAETSKVSIYHHGAPYYNFIYPLGGYLVTNDIAAGLKVSLGTAEKVKLAFGITHFDYLTTNETIQIPSIGGRKPRLLARENLIHIIRPRVEEMFNIIKQDIIDKGYIDKIQGGIVLTGGTANLSGISDVCQEVFDIQARVGVPKRLPGLGDKIDSPDYAVVNGLIRWGLEKMNREDDLINKKEKNDKGVFKVIKKIFDELF